MKAIQIRMGRAALGWGVRELAEKAGVTANTISRIEGGSDSKASTLDAIRAAFEEAGLTFLEDGELKDGGLGVRLTTRR
ncbi:MAG: helix-turn-helix domain-containing protein [Rhizobiales bacterium]|nr:helix-turn-helix domain-containing protein [Hyphomicrobiales bacterium]